MSIKRNVLARAATLMIAAGVMTVGTLSASAATSACGNACISLFSAELGSYGQPNVVEAVLDGVAKVGQPMILAPADSSDPSQDIIVNRGAKVSDFYADGLVSAEVNSHYGELDAAMIEYAPFGLGTGLCAGIAETAFQGEGLTLQPCTSARTVWIIDPSVSPTAGYFAVVSGSTTDVARPFAMHYPQDQQAADSRTQQIQVRRLQFRSNEDTVADRQLWGLHMGVVP